ncbi:MAG: DUF2075 domain-containing protein [Burkholderiales bacterium]|jgi:hypothetical protein|nr:DUF2075 domain-containing protein [Burkholderiales bacterium]
MTTFIPEWVRVSGRNLHIKRVLNTFDDEHVVRRPLRAESCVADFFVQYRTKGWLAVAVDEIRFSEVDPSQLFESPRRASFERRLAELQRLRAGHSGFADELPSLVIMWTWSTDEVRTVKTHYLERFGVRLVSREQFGQLGSKLVKGLLAPISDEALQSLLGSYFPEAEIPADCTTRRFFRRDNSARLGRFFLDHEQEWASKIDLEAPAEQTDTARDFFVRLVNGVAGSGKTLIALNRALLLAEMNPDDRVLVLIHNTPVVADIKERLHRTRNALPANLEVNTFFAWAYQQWRRMFNAHPKMPERPQQVPELVRHYRRQWPDLRLSDIQLTDEMDFINEALILDETSYLAASRTGRGFALRQGDRLQVWAIYRSVTEALLRSRLRMWSALPREICVAGDRHSRMQKYRHILIDEAQFFAPSWFQVVKLSMQLDGNLFMCADPNQGFMKRRLSWKSVGIEVAGRTKKLRKSYRTTKAILQAASSVLSALGPGNGEDHLEPDFEGMEEGERPVLIYADSPQDAMDCVVNEVASAGADGSLPLAAMLVIYGENVQRAALYSQLGRKLGADRVWWFNERDQKKEPPCGYGKDYLRMAYVDTATGLEGGVVFLVGIEALFFENVRPGLNEGEQAEIREARARKLYMAMTRAGHRLVVISSQRLPRAMERLFAVLEQRICCGGFSG